MIKNEEVQSGLYVDWSEAPQNIPVTGSYFEFPTCFIFDDNIFKGSDENGKN